MSILSPVESYNGYFEAFKDLRTLEEGSWSLMNHIISDFHHAPKLAYEKLEGRPIQVWTGCQGGNSTDILNLGQFFICHPKNV